MDALLQSLLGEVDDKTSHKEQGELDEITKVGLLTCLTKLAADILRIFHNHRSLIASSWP